MLGMELMLANMVGGPEKLKEIFATFENIKTGVVEFKNAINTLGEKIDASDKRAEERHKEILEALGKLAP